MKSVSAATRKRRLLKLAEHMETSVKRREFSMSLYGVWDGSSAYGLAKHECGTVGCIAGHAIARFRRSVDFGMEFHPFDAARDLLGLSGREAGALFLDYGIRTPKQAAERLRALAASGGAK